MFVECPPRGCEGKRKSESLAGVVEHYTLSKKKAGVFHVSYVLVCVGVVLELNKLQATVELTVGSLSPQGYSECLGPKMVCSQ